MDLFFCTVLCPFLLHLVSAASQSLRSAYLRASIVEYQNLQTLPLDKSRLPSIAMDPECLVCLHPHHLAISPNTVPSQRKIRNTTQLVARPYVFQPFLSLIDGQTRKTSPEIEPLSPLSSFVFSICRPPGFRYSIYLAAAPLVSGHVMSRLLHVAVRAEWNNSDARRYRASEYQGPTPQARGPAFHPVVLRQAIPTCFRS